jgi:hypothetical protein
MLSIIGVGHTVANFECVVALQEMSVNDLIAGLPHIALSENADLENAKQVCASAAEPSVLQLQRSHCNSQGNVCFESVCKLILSVHHLLAHRH